jgi:hypothetical protein
MESSPLLSFAQFAEEMSVGSGAVAGLEPDEPPVSKKSQVKYARRNGRSVAPRREGKDS